MAKIYIGLDIYDYKDFNYILANTQCDGLILGDLFCENRMFENGNNDLIKFFDILSKTKKDIIYQLPYYITSRNRTQIMNNLKTLQALKPDAIILVTDVGYANLIKNTYTTFRLSWSNMQRNRENSRNEYTYEFLKELGVDYIETPEKDTINNIRSHGIEPWLVYGFTRYKTFGRVCYVQQQLSQNLPECRKTCIDSGYSLVEDRTGYELTMDGYILGKKFEYANDIIDKNETICVYAKNYKNLQKILREIPNEKI